MHRPSPGSAARPYHAGPPTEVPHTLPTYRVRPDIRDGRLSRPTGPGQPMGGLNEDPAVMARQPYRIATERNQVPPGEFHSSAEAKLMPAATSTVPSASRVAACMRRVAIIFPAALNAPEAGS